MARCSRGVACLLTIVVPTPPPNGGHGLENVIEKLAFQLSDVKVELLIAQKERDIFKEKLLRCTCAGDIGPKSPRQHDKHTRSVRTTDKTHKDAPLSARGTSGTPLGRSISANTSKKSQRESIKRLKSEGKDSTAKDISPPPKNSPRRFHKDPDPASQSDDGIKKERSKGALRKFGADLNQFLTSPRNRKDDKKGSPSTTDHDIGNGNDQPDAPPAHAPKLHNSTAGLRSNSMQQRTQHETGISANSKFHNGTKSLNTEKPTKETSALTPNYGKPLKPSLSANSIPHSIPATGRKDPIGSNLKVHRLSAVVDTPQQHPPAVSDPPDQSIFGLTTLSRAGHDSNKQRKPLPDRPLLQSEQKGPADSEVFRSAFLGIDGFTALGEAQEHPEFSRSQSLDDTQKTPTTISKRIPNWAQRSDGKTDTAVATQVTPEQSSEDIATVTTGRRPKPPMVKQISKARIVPGRLDALGTGRGQREVPLEAHEEGIALSPRSPDVQTGSLPQTETPAADNGAVMTAEAMEALLAGFGFD